MSAAPTSGRFGTHWLAVVVFTALAACSGGDPKVEQTPPSDAQLWAQCWDSTPLDHAACAEVGARKLASGDTKDGMRAMGLACAKFGRSCVELGLIHYEGVLVPKSLDKALSKFGLGCNKRDGSDACAYEAVVMLEAGTEAKVVHGPMDLSCRFNDTTGWPCYNLGVGLSCGLFGAPQRENALGALQKGCRLGDDRACKLHLEYGEGRAEPVCTMIGPDPKRPLVMDLKLGPHGQVGVPAADGKGEVEQGPSGDAGVRGSP